MLLVAVLIFLIVIYYLFKQNSSSRRSSMMSRDQQGQNFTYVGSDGEGSKYNQPNRFDPGLFQTYIRASSKIPDSVLASNNYFELPEDDSRSREWFSEESEIENPVFVDEETSRGSDWDNHVAFPDMPKTSLGLERDPNNPASFLYERPVHSNLKSRNSAFSDVLRGDLVIEKRPMISQSSLTQADTRKSYFN